MVSPRCAEHPRCSENTLYSHYRVVGDGFRGFEDSECFVGFYKAERELKNFGGARKRTKKARRGQEGTEKVRGQSLDGL